MVKVGVIGLGMMGLTHLDAYAKNKNVKIAAICDSDPARLSGTAHAAGNIEGVENIMLRLQSADGEAYSANFITFSSAKGKPEDFYGRAKNEIIAARKTWLELMTLLALKP